jgi:hypothetical protein
MVDWQITAATIHCSAVATEATIIVKNDWSVKCTTFEEIAHSRQARIGLLKRAINLKRALECKGMQCQQITEYIQKLQAEENQKDSPDVANK